MKMRTTNLLTKLVIVAFGACSIGALAAACGDDDGGSADTDADTDTDTDTDSDTDTDTDGDADCTACLADDTKTACFNRVVGHVTSENAAAALTAQICAPACIPMTVETDGTISKDFTTCMSFPLSNEDDIHVTIGENPDANADTQTRYSLAFAPTQEEISAEFEYDLGEFARFTLPTDGTAYTAAGGATVTDLEGVSFDVAAGGLGDTDCEIRVFSHPLDGDTPRFVPADVTLDALFFFSPYFWGVPDEAEGLSLGIDAASVGWTDGDTGSYYLLGDFASSNFVACPDASEDLQLGHFEACGTVTAAAGVIPIPDFAVLGWLGLAKDE